MEKTSEMTLRRLVGAVLRPHDGVHGQFELARIPAEQLDDGGELVVGEAQFPVKGLPRQGFAHESRRIVVKGAKQKDKRSSCPRYEENGDRVIERKDPHAKSERHGVLTMAKPAKRTMTAEHK